MEYRELGKTGLRVSRLCFGTLTLGPLQARLEHAAGVALLAKAYEKGVNFYDTAQSYGTYDFLRAHIKNVGRSHVIITSKSYASSQIQAEAALYDALKALDTDYLDIMLLHEQVSASTLQGHQAALDSWSKAKEAGYLRAIGMSTHHVAAVRAAIMNEAIEVVHPLFNYAGFGIQDGDAAMMYAAMQECFWMGKGIYAMKALGGGHLRAQAAEAIAYVLEKPELASIAIGMQNETELQVNTAYFNADHPDAFLLNALDKQPRHLHIESYCQRCGKCLSHCSSGALHLDSQGLRVDHDLCLTCGYCAKACPEFALKIL